MTPRKPITRRQAREYDAAAIARGVSGVTLMENAAAAAVELLLPLGAAGPIAVVCGKGNNGGDGFAMARMLDERSVPVWVESAVEPAKITGDALTAWKALSARAVEIHELTEDVDALAARLRRAEWVVDALLGTGAEGPPRPPIADYIRAINASRAHVLAVDLPSGLDADTGAAGAPTVRADHTATFVAPKLGFLNPAASAWIGEVHVLDIGGGDVE